MINFDGDPLTCANARMSGLPPWMAALTVVSSGDGDRRVVTVRDGYRGPSCRAAIH